MVMRPATPCSFTHWPIRRGRVSTNASCAAPPVIFSKFHVRFYATHLRVANGRLVASTPTVIFSEAEGWNVSIYADLDGWVVYDRYHAYELNGGSDWQLIARNIATGRRVVVDDPAIEGVAFNPQEARSDGRTVVFTAYAQRPGGAQPVVEAYDLATGKRTVVTEGDAFNHWSYFGPTVSGNEISVEKVYAPSGRN